MTQDERREAGASAYRNNMNRLVAEATGCEATFDAAIRLAFREGARFALENQWIDPKDELPEIEEWVDVCICRTDNSIKYRFEARHEGNGIFMAEDNIKYDCISYWMRIPDTPKI